MSSAILRHGVRVGDPTARVPVAPRVPQQLYGSARGQRAATGVVQTGSHAALDAASAPRQEASTKTGDKADASRLCPHVPAAWRHAERWNAAGQNPANANDIASRILVVGEELALPFGLLRSERLDGLWNEPFQARIRAAILGETTDNDNFE